MALSPRSPEIDAVLTMRPPESTRWGIAARVMLNTPVKPMLMIFCHSSSVTSPALPHPLTPAFRNPILVGPEDHAGRDRHDLPSVSHGTVRPLDGEERTSAGD